MSSVRQNLTIDIVSDVVCQWCIIGYRQLVQALEALGDQVDATIVWHPFELAPDTPPEGQSLADYARNRYGATPEQSRRNRDRIIAAGAALGIEFRYSDASRIYNTHKAHQLLKWAANTGRQTALKLALFAAYFTDQKNVADDSVLLDAVDAAGLDRIDAAAVLASGAEARPVRAEEAYWQDHNISGVPAYIVDGRFLIPGAQDAHAFQRVIERILERRAANTA